MSAVATDLRTAAIRPPRRKFHCPRCGRFLFSSSSGDGVSEVNCRGCRRWLLIDITTGKEAAAA